MFTTVNVAKHDEIKAKLLGPYSGRELEGMEPRYVILFFSGFKGPDVSTCSVFGGLAYFKQEDLAYESQIARGKSDPLQIANLKFLLSVDDFIIGLVQYLRGKITTNTHGPAVVDFALISMYFTMDVITRLAFGEELGFLRTDSDVHGLLQQIRGSLRIAFIPLVVPWFRDIAFSKPLFRFLRPKPTDRQGLGVALR